MKKKSKHYDSKRDLIAAMKENKRRADYAVFASFTAYMLMATLTLYEDLNFRETRIRKFVDGFYKRLDMYRAGALSVHGMEKDLLKKAGVVVQPPKVEI